VTPAVLTRIKKALFRDGVVSFPLIELFHPCYRFARALFGGLRESFP
jgi:hypothetical protein